MLVGYPKSGILPIKICASCPKGKSFATNGRKKPGELADQVHVDAVAAISHDL